MQANFSGSITLNVTIFWQHAWGAANSHLLLLLVFASANRRTRWLEGDRVEKLSKFPRLRWHGPKSNRCSCMQNNFVGRKHFLVQSFHNPQPEMSFWGDVLQNLPRNMMWFHRGNQLYRDPTTIDNFLGMTRWASDFWSLPKMIIVIDGYWWQKLPWDFFFTFCVKKWWPWVSLILLRCGLFSQPTAIWSSPTKHHRNSVYTQHQGIKEGFGASYNWKLMLLRLSKR